MRLRTQAGRAPAALLTPIPQTVSRVEIASTVGRCVWLVIGITPFLEQVGRSLQVATRRITSKSGAPRPTYAQGLEPCATSPVNLNPQACWRFLFYQFRKSRTLDGMRWQETRKRNGESPRIACGNAHSRRRTLRR